MFRIRCVPDTILPEDRAVVGQVQEILRRQFPGLDPGEIDKLPDQLRDPMAHRFRSVLFVADDGGPRVLGFALALHAPDLRFCYLDYISTAARLGGGGVGGSLYQRVREEARDQGCVGLFFESLSDDPAVCTDPASIKENAKRLRFYEQYGARPVAGTLYETPIRPDDCCPPSLVFDGLGSGKPLRRANARAIVRAILERKYGEACPPGYIDQVVASFRDDPMRLREPRHATGDAPLREVRPVGSVEKRIALTVNDRHEIHHVRERGYVESPVRVRTILGPILETGLFDRVEPRHFGEKHILAVHDRDFVTYLKRVCANVPDNHSVYPYVFPIRNGARPPRDLPVRAGYYCIDTFTPLNQNAHRAATRAVDCALTAAETLFHGRRLAYALVRPPGHHAERRAFGGFCYFNSAAVAAHHLSALGPVAVLDVDYHHGNGTQSIFYERADVLTVSIHGHPRFAYPYFSGFADETGEGEGRGFNLNLPLPEHVEGPRYREALEKGLRRIRAFQPRFLVVALGLDPAKGDPTGSWSLGYRDFRENGRLIGALNLPTLVVQEGGYRIRGLGTNARNFFEGLWKGAFGRKNDTR
ncbi:MAG TPA: histone deacetylase family protein [Deferrisomatales bacterium]|nr:histone deacetylase family protein [Deferrisomatales bacterium]